MDANLPHGSGGSRRGRRAAAPLGAAALALLAAACVAAEGPVAENGTTMSDARADGAERGTTLPEPSSRHARPPATPTSDTPPAGLLAASDGPHALAGGGTRIVLAPLAAEAAAATLRELGARRLQLVLRDLAADEAPGVLFRLHLDLDSGAGPVDEPTAESEDDDPATEDPNFLGSLNFFGVETGGATSAMRTYDVSPLAGRLAAALDAGRPLVLTVRSASPPAGTPRIGRVELLVEP